MYKNLSADTLGISARQSEKIELALTYGFAGIDVDILDMIKRAEGKGLDHARRYVESANIRVGGFELPIDWQADDATFKASLGELERAAEIGAAVGAAGCWTTIQPASDTQPYHENFEFHRGRLAETADLLAKHELRLGLAFLAAEPRRAGREFQFIHQAEAILTLMKSVGAANVGLALDGWNWFVGGGNDDQLRELSPQQIVTVRLADAPADTDAATIEETACLLPGKGGAIDSSKTLAALAEIGYDGPVAVQADPAHFKGLTRDAIVQQAATALDELWAATEPSNADKLSPAVAES